MLIGRVAVVIVDSVESIIINYKQQTVRQNIFDGNDVSDETKGIGVILQQRQ